MIAASKNWTIIRWWHRDHTRTSVATFRKICSIRPHNDRKLSDIYHGYMYLYIWDHTYNGCAQKSRYRQIPTFQHALEDYQSLRYKLRCASWGTMCLKTVHLALSASCPTLLSLEVSQVLSASVLILFLPHLSQRSGSSPHCSPHCSPPLHFFWFTSSTAFVIVPYDNSPLTSFLRAAVYSPIFPHFINSLFCQLNGEEGSETHKRSWKGGSVFQWFMDLHFALGKVGVAYLRNCLI